MAGGPHITQRWPGNPPTPKTKSCKSCDEECIGEFCSTYCVAEYRRREREAPKVAPTPALVVDREPPELLGDLEYCLCACGLTRREVRLGGKHGPYAPRLS